ncbi:DNA (cytosine-5-)-methyltransferase [Apibacter muscae]|uniref:DNA (cytosine-5-)-methyltransferase n=1 Tax=Apibacter muscae TaxID=2509004 RepID=UPI003743A9D6
MGWENVLHCEINPILRQFLQIKYPKAISYEDIKKTDFTLWRGKINVLTGGFPCQPFSFAGQRKGTEDDRHLWPEMLRAIREIQPRWIVGENVRGLLSWDEGMVFEQVLIELEAEGYQVTPFLLPACGVNAPHRRDRIFFIAYCADARIESVQQRRENRIFGSRFTSNPDSIRGGRRTTKSEWKEKKKDFRTGVYSKTTRSSLFRITSNSCNERLQGRKIHRNSKKSRSFKKEFSTRFFCSNWQDFPTQSPICNGNDGFSAESLRTIIRNSTYGILSEKEENKIISETISRTRKEIIQAGGNAVVPPLILQIFKAIEKYETNRTNNQRKTTSTR